MLLRDIAKIEQVIKWPVAEWVGQCHAVSVEIYKAKLVPETSRVRYGIWWGSISSKSHFAGRTFTHHGWIELPDKRVYDPTRWVFEAVDPYIWIGRHSRDYDIAGQRLNKRFYSVCPPPLGEPVALNAQQRAVIAPFIPSVVERDPDFEQLMWLAHMPFDDLGDQAATVYKIFEELGHIALIPLDNRRYVLEDDRIYT